MAAVTGPLFILGAGAVTAAGLDAAQTTAAIRASFSAASENWLLEPLGISQTVARIPSHWQLRSDDGEWLVNMATRALDEAMRDSAHPSESTALLLAPPESFRGHPAFAAVPPSAFFARVAGATGRRFHPSSRAVDGGAAASVGLLDRIGALLDGGAAQVVLGGVDSLVNETDIARLRRADRLKTPDNAQGFVPGEGACFVRIARGSETGEAAVAAIRGAGLAQEKDSALSDRFSQGRALLSALRDATSAQGGPREADVDFVVSNGNGERYSGLEQLIARPRFYRTRRERLVVAYPAMTVGEIGAASGALALMLAADSLAKGYAPGRVAMCEVASEGGLRAAAVLGAVRQG